jgi:putative oxidoreductase
MATAESASQTRRSSLASWKSSKLTFASRVLLGLLLISGGINNFLARNPVSNPTPEGDRFLSFLQETGYLLHAVAITEIAVGVLLLSGYFLPLALVVFAPILVNIALFHIFVQFAGIETALVAAVLYGYLVYVHRDRLSGLLAR